MVSIVLAFIFFLTVTGRLLATKVMYSSSGSHHLFKINLNAIEGIYVDLESVDCMWLNVIACWMVLQPESPWDSRKLQEISWDSMGSCEELTHCLCRNSRKILIVFNIILDHLDVVPSLLPHFWQPPPGKIGLRPNSIFLSQNVCFLYLGKIKKF